MNMQADSTRMLADHGTILQRVIDSHNRIRLHGNQETGTELLTRCSCIKVGRCRVNEQLLTQHVVGLKRLIQILGSPECQRDTHNQMLRAFERLALRIAKQVL